VSEVSSLENEIRAGAVSALRRRAASQVAKARAGAARTESGGAIRTGEIASRVANALGALADEIEREGRASSDAAAKRPNRLWPSEAERIDRSYRPKTCENSRAIRYSFALHAGTLIWMACPASSGPSALVWRQDFY
jgi:hypothetical protein